MANKKEGNSNSGLVALIICGGIALALIVWCVFFPDQIFGLFIK